MYDPKEDAFKFHQETFGPQEKFGYKDFAPHLTANRFNADEWIALFKEAGARFIVPVSCFHDGFAMWDSKLTDWNAVKKGPMRDYDGLLAAAARKQGLKFGVAWHAFYRPVYFRTGRRPGTDMQPPHIDTPWSVYGPGEVPISREFIDDSLGRLVELVDGYQPDLIWFDFDTENANPADLRRFAAFYFNRASQWKKGVAINDKHESLFPPHSIVLDFERGKTSGLRPELWQTDTSVSWRDWSYMRNDAFKTVDELVCELVDIVSKNGVLLLDIGPRPDGSIPPEPQAILRGIGAWLKVNGEAIYGTRPCWALGFGEGPHNSGGGGGSDRQVEYNHKDFRFTQKDNVLYAIAMDWPDVDDYFLIRALSDQSTFASGGIKEVNLLGEKKTLDWKQTPEGLWIRRPDRRPCDGAYAFKIVTDGISVEKLAAERTSEDQLKVNIRLRNLDARPVKQDIAICSDGQVIGNVSVSLGARETISRSVVLAAPPKAFEIITASVTGGKLFVVRDEVVSPPTLGDVWKFDGSSMLSVSGLGKLDKLTVSLWIRTESLREPWTALLNTAGWGPGGLHVQYLQSGSLQVALRGTDSDVNGTSTSAPGAAGGWRMISITYDAVAEQANIYVNGKHESQVSIPHAQPVNLDQFTLGGWTIGERRFHGQMADVRIYNRVLSSIEIRSLIKGEPCSEAPIAEWDFKKADGSGAPDASGHSHRATVVK